ncbi:type II secretion system F family protein (plasmid) [Micromonospora zamorensis]|uniref:type II secretion system F family protein n=1 Tax=Micromonospora zamorensis TaxID=709883 RepID=UPI002E209FBA
MSSYLTWMILAGAMIGLGVFFLVLQLVPASPALGPALRRLHPAAAASQPRPAVGWIRRNFRIPDSDLQLLNRTTDQYLLTLGLATLFALLLPALITAAVVLLRLPISPAIPGVGTALAAVAAPWLAHRDVIAKADTARDEFVRAMCTYLDLAAHQVLGGHGPVESLTRAAGICDGWVFDRIRQALLAAELQMRAPWDELRVLSRAINVVELGDLADIMNSAGNEGAAVYETLRARADSLRDQLRTQALAQAEVRTTKLDIPASALIFILLVLMGYPFITRLFV